MRRPSRDDDDAHHRRSSSAAGEDAGAQQRRRKRRSGWDTSGDGGDGGDGGGAGGDSAVNLADVLSSLTEEQKLVLIRQQKLLILQQQVNAATKKAREIYVGNLAAGSVNAENLRDHFNNLFRQLPDFAQKYDSLMVSHSLALCIKAERPTFRCL